MGVRGAVVGGEFVGDEQDTFQLFESGEIFIGFFRNPLVQSLDFWVGDEFSA